jgi:fructosamine-3-kinase
MAGYDTVATKSVLSLVGKDRTVKVFVKISNSERLSHYLEVEAEGLSSCSKSGMRGVPQVLARGSIEGRYFLAQRYIPGPTMHGSRRYLDEALIRTRDWLSELYGKTRGSYIEPADLIRRARRYAETASDFFDLTDCVSFLEKLSPGGWVPTYRIHGDFWHRNILLSGDEVYVTDFAFSAAGEPPIDHLDLLSDYDPEIFLNPKQIARYSKDLPLEGNSILFLHLYSLLRKIGLKVERREELYGELLLNNLEGSLNEIREVGVAKRLVRRYESGSAWKSA